LTQNILYSIFQLKMQQKKQIHSLITSLPQVTVFALFSLYWFRIDFVIKEFWNVVWS